VVSVTGGSNKRVSLAALIAVRPGSRPRLIYRVHRRPPGRTDKRKGFTEADYAALLDAAHQQLGGPLVVVWDNLNTHVSAAMSELIAARDWLTVLPAAALRPRAQPRRAGVVAPETIPGQPGQAQHHRANCPGEDPAPADAIPGCPARRIPGQHPPRPHTVL